MTKTKFMSLVLVFAMILSMIPISPSVVRAEENGLTYETLKDAVNALLAKVADLEDIERVAAILILTHYAKIDTDEDNNGIDDGIDTLREMVLSLGSDSDSIIPDGLAERIVNYLSAKGITLEQAAKATELLTIWDVEDRVTLIKSLDSDSPIEFFVTEQEEKDLISDILNDFPDMATLFEAEGYSIDEFSFFAFVAQRAMDGPIFTDNGPDAIKFIDNEKFNELKTKMSNALSGLTISGRTFNEETINNLFVNFEGVINGRIVGKVDIAKSILVKYDLYKSSEQAAIKLVPVYDIIGENENALVNIVLTNKLGLPISDLNINSLQVNVSYDSKLKLTDIKKGNTSLIRDDNPEYNDNGDYAEIIDIDNEGIVSYAFTYLNDGFWDAQNNEEVIATLEFTGKQIGQSQLSYDETILLDTTGTEITGYLTIGSVVEVRGVAEVEAPEVSNVFVGEKEIDSDEEITISENDFTVTGFVDPSESTVKVNGEEVEVNSIIGKFTYEFTDVEQQQLVEIEASNTAGTDTFTFTVNVDKTGPIITVNGVENNGLYNEDKEIIFEVNEGEIVSAELNGETFNSGDTVSVNDGEESEFTLVIVAKDLLGNETTKTVNFKIDKVAPEIIVIGVKEGITFGKARIFIAVSEGTYTATLNGEEVDNGALVDATGDYTLVVVATDELGNESTKTINFSIDGEAPNVVDGTIEIDNTVVKAGDTVNISFETTETIERGFLNVGFVKFAIPLVVDGNNVSVSYEVPADINAKKIQLRVVLVDGTGNVSNPIKIGTITIDNKSPRVFLYEDDEVEYGLNDFIVSDTLIFHISTDGSKIEWNIDSEEAITINEDSADITIDSSYSDGEEHTIYYTAFDEVGNSTGGEFTFKWDNTAPTKPVITNSETITASSSIELDGTVEDGANVIVKKIRNGNEVPVKYVDALPETVHLRNGENSFIIYAIDEAGNLSVASDVYTINKDSKKPLINVERVDDSNEVTIESNEELSSITAKHILDGVETTVTVSEADDNYVIADGEIDFSLSGTHKVIVTATDLTGNEGKGRYTTVTIPETIEEDIPLTEELTLGVGTTALTGELVIETVIVDADEDKEFVSEPIDFEGDFTEGEYVIVRLNLGSDLPESTKLYYFDGSDWIALDGTTDDGDSKYNPHSSNVMSTTVDGMPFDINPGELVAVLKHFSVYGAMADTTAPEVVITSHVEDQKIGNKDLVDGKIVVEGTVSENATVTVNGTEVVVDDNSGVFTVELNPVDGALTINATATDEAGNTTAEAVVVNVSVDTIIPTIGFTPENNPTKNNPENLTIDITEANNATTNVYKNSVNDENLIYTTNNKTMNIPVDLDEGSNTIIAVATDEFGNSKQDSIAITLDTIGPNITINGVKDGDTVGSNVDVDIELNEGTFVAKLFEGAAQIGGDHTSDFTVNVITEESHTYTLKVTATDNLGNENYKEIEFTIDDRLPEISIDVTDGYVTKNDVTVNVTTDGDYETYSLTKDNSPIPFENGNTITEDGEYSLVVVATKTNGNLVATKTVNFTIDKVEPVVTITGINDGGSYTTAVTPVIEVTDNHDESVTVVTTLNGEEFTSGTTVSDIAVYTLVVTATDEALNETEVTYTFTIKSPPSGGGGVTAPVTKESRRITTSGGKAMFFGEEVTIDFENGTFDSSVRVYVEVIDEEDVTLPEGTENAKFKLAGNVYDFDAQGKTFNKPVTVTLAFDKDKVTDANKVGIYYYNEETKSWEYVGGKVDLENGTVKVTLSHFSKYAVMSFDKTFDDIANHWAKEDIELMASRHIVKGKSDNMFDPKGDITRAEFATMLVRIIGAELIEGESSFEDVTTDKWYAPYIEAAYQAGLVKGISETEFAPEENITREQMATMIMRAYNHLTEEDYNELVTTTELRFNDESEISDWAHKAVIIASDLGIIKGMTETTFVPKENATRAQSAVMIKRLLEATDNL